MATGEKKLEGKPIFLLDNQKTLTSHVDPLRNYFHQEPLDFTAYDYLVASRMLRIFSRVFERVSFPLKERVIADGVYAQVQYLEVAFATRVDPEDLLEGVNYSLNNLRKDLVSKPRVSHLPDSANIDHVSGWKLTEQGRDLVMAIKRRFDCIQIVVSGIGDVQYRQLADSFAKQEVLQYLDDPKFFLRSPSIQSTHIYKAFVNGAVRNLGKPTIPIDDDPNTISTIQKFVGGPAVLASTPEAAKKYTKSKGVELIESPLSGPVYQLGVHGDSLEELAYLALVWWESNDYVKY